MAQTIRSDMMRKLIAVSMVLGSTTAQAQNCMQYPPGPFRAARHCRHPKPSFRGRPPLQIPPRRCAKGNGRRLPH